MLQENGLIALQPYRESQVEYFSVVHPIRKNVPLVGTITLNIHATPI